MSNAMRIVVVLPEPLGPTKPKISPRSTTKETLSTTARRPYILVTSFVSRPRAEWSASTPGLVE